MNNSRERKHDLAPHARRKLRPRGRPFEPGNTLGLATQFPKGVSGNASGRTKYAVAAEAARVLLGSLIPDDPEGRLFAEGICHRLGWMALAGDRAAAELLFERAEGRPRQAIEISNGPDPIEALIAEFRLARGAGLNGDEKVIDVEPVERGAVGETKSLPPG